MKMNVIYVCCFAWWNRLMARHVHGKRPTVRFSFFPSHQVEMSQIVSFKKRKRRFIFILEIHLIVMRVSV